MSGHPFRKILLVGATLCLVNSAIQPATGLPDLRSRLEAIDRLIFDGRYAEAAGSGRHLLEIVETEYGPDSLEAASVIHVLADALWRGGQIDDEVGALATRALTIRERTLGPDDPEVASSLNTLGNFRLMSGDYSGARVAYERSLAIRLATLAPDHEDIATSYSNLAYVLFHLGDYAGARPYYDRAREIREKVLGPEHPKLASTLMKLGILYLREGDHDRSRAHFTRALQILEKRHGAMHPDVIAARYQVGVVDVMEHRYDEALGLFETNVEACTEVLGPDHPDTASNMNAMGNVLWGLGRWDEAAAWFGKALLVVEKVYGHEHRQVALLLSNRAYALAHAGRFDEALPMYDRALEISRHADGEDHVHYAEVLVKLAGLHQARGDYRAALDRALQAEKIMREQFLKTAGNLTESEALRFQASLFFERDVALVALASMKSEDAREVAATTWDHLVRSRALVMDEMAARRRGLSHIGRDDTALLEKSLDDARSELASLVVAGGDEKYIERLRQLQEEQERLERELARRSLEVRRREDRRQIGFDDVTGALPSGTALISYVRYRKLTYPGDPDYPDRTAVPNDSRGPRLVSFYMALVHRLDDRRPRVVPLGRSDAIGELLRAWRTLANTPPPVVPLAARKSAAACRKAGERLRQAIWDPVAAYVEEADQVFVVPDGLIHLVNIGALPGDNGTFIVETGPLLHYVSAERDIIRHPDRNTPPGSFLAVGGADFDLLPEDATTGHAGVAPGLAAPQDRRHAPCEALAAMRFDPLPGSKSEVREIVDLWEKGNGSDGSPITALTGPEATEAAVRRLAPGRRILHLATHAVMALDACGPGNDPSLSGGRMDYLDRELRSRIADDPMIVSLLALTGANTRRERSAGVAGDDGILTAEEISSLDLGGVEWVVLSACETGVGRLASGEGVLGLRRAFENAGAGTLIMSLWPVEDLATRQWMTNLYRHRLEGMSTAEAMRAATRDRIDRQRRTRRPVHPFTWGAFIATGDWR